MTNLKLTPKETPINVDDKIFIKTLFNDIVILGQKTLGKNYIEVVSRQFGRVYFVEFRKEGEYKFNHSLNSFTKPRFNTVKNIELTFEGDIIKIDDIEAKELWIELQKEGFKS